MSKTLVAYFSYSGNTKGVAERVADILGADIFEIQPEVPYSSDYQECVDAARKELAESARPAIIGKVDDMSQYDTIILGFPNWCRTCPMPVFSFLEAYDLSGKKIYSFVMNGGGGCGNSTQDIKTSAVGATVADAVDGNNLSDSQIKEWV